MSQLPMKRIGGALSPMSQTLLRTSDDIGDSGGVALRTELRIAGKCHVRLFIMRVDPYGNQGKKITPSGLAFMYRLLH